MSTVGLTITLPEVAPPVLKPPPVQDVVLAEDQVTVAVPPEATEEGLAEIFAVGDGGGITAHLLPSQKVPDAQLAYTLHTDRIGTCHIKGL